MPFGLGSRQASMPRVQMSDVVRVGPVMALPLVGSDSTRGALVVGRIEGRAPFSVAEMDMASTFAGHAAVALELADARAAKDRLALLEDRGRIARDLHDHVIQRLYATGMSLQQTLSKVDEIRIPMLIAQGANDPRVTQAEAEQIVEAMKAKGIDHEYLLFSDEGHGFVKPENRLKFYEVAEAFLAAHL